MRLSVWRHLLVEVPAFENGISQFGIKKFAFVTSNVYAFKH